MKVVLRRIIIRKGNSRLVSTSQDHVAYMANAMDKVGIKACLFVTNFSNPVGSCMSDERRRQLVALLTDRNIPLMEDDVKEQSFKTLGELIREFE
ncbi:MAG: GntR family transcriptional regulator YdcR [Mucilaginibacter sp.]|nr:GntR family transcriptional regulator YdcR [Mucilaginibacter sp.]